MTNHPDHYFSESPRSSSTSRTYSFVGAGRQFEMSTDSGVFSRDRLDKGTAVLLDAFDSGKLTIKTEMAGDILDLGCGVGPLTVVLAHCFPQSHIWAVDINERARELCKKNSRAHGLTNVTVAHPDDVPHDTTFWLMWSNPPVRIGKDALHTLSNQWLPTLRSDGVAHFVMSKNLGADSYAQWLTSHDYSVERCASSKGFRVLSIRRRTDND